MLSKAVHKNRIAPTRKRKREIPRAPRQKSPWTPLQETFLRVPEAKRDFAWWDQFPNVWDIQMRARVPIARLSDADLKRLANCFVFGVIPIEERPLSAGAGMPAASLRNYAARWRRDLPTDEERLALSKLIQGSPEWLDKRAEGIGGSETGEITNTSHYRSRRDVWFKHVGILAEPARAPADCFFFDHGHAGEPHAAEYYSIAMQSMALVESGIIAHWKYPFSQASPDRLVISRPWIVHNEWSRFDDIRGNQEIKRPVYTVHASKLRVDYPFMITNDYCTQQQGQSDTCKTQWNDFTSCWCAGVCKNVQPLPRPAPTFLPRALGMWSTQACMEQYQGRVRRMAKEVYPDVEDPSDVEKWVFGYLPVTGENLQPDGHYVTSQAEQMVTISQLIQSYLGPEWWSPRAYLAGRMLITRQYHNPTYCDAMYQTIANHVESVRTLTEPPVPEGNHSYPYMGGPIEDAMEEHHHDNFGDAKLILLPMKKVEWVIHSTSRPPLYHELFPNVPEYTDIRQNQDELKRGVLDGWFQQSVTIKAQVGVHWLEPTFPEYWKGSRTHFYITVFVTAYPCARPLKNDDGLTALDIDNYDKKSRKTAH